MLRENLTQVTVVNLDTQFKPFKFEMEEGI